MTDVWVPLLIGVVLPIGIMGGVLLQDRLHNRLPWPVLSRDRGVR